MSGYKSITVGECESLLIEVENISGGELNIWASMIEEPQRPPGWSDIRFFTDYCEFIGCVMNQPGIVQFKVSGIDDGGRKLWFSGSCNINITGLIHEAGIGQPDEDGVRWSNLYAVTDWKLQANVRIELEESA